jgi:hypothetical protein
MKRANTNFAQDARFGSPPCHPSHFAGRLVLERFKQGLNALECLFFDNPFGLKSEFMGMEVL